MSILDESTVAFLPLYNGNFFLELEGYSEDDPDQMCLTGLIQSYEPVGLLFEALQRFGTIGVETAILPSDPGAPSDDWDDVVEASFMATGAASLTDGEQGNGVPIALEVGRDYRLRYSLIGSDLMDAFGGATPERFRLEFWADEPRASVVLVNRSARARYWIGTRVLEVNARRFAHLLTWDSSDEERAAYLESALTELDRIGLTIEPDAGVDDWRVDKVASGAPGPWRGWPADLPREDIGKWSHDLALFNRQRVLEAVRRRG